jgi:exopolyphosphatase / guanosine-5'-triphosphate,3'-diphosphate pyrophosphatase
MDRNNSGEGQGMRIASIDIGTNTILMLVADIERHTDQFRFSVIRDELVVARLGKGVDEHRRILPGTFERVRDFLRTYRRIAEECAVESIIACGTSALRDATNRDEFLAYIEKETGISIRILSGDDEARLTFFGAVSEYPSGDASYSVIDIGGGSTELINGSYRTTFNNVSLDIGSVRLTERFLKSSPPTELQVEDTIEYIRATLAGARFLPQKDSRLIGVAGTVTTLAAIHQQLPSYDPKKIGGYILTIGAIESMYEQLRPLTVEQIRSIPQISAGRADIILAGILILKEFMYACDSGVITASNRGLRYGLAMDVISQ